MYFSPPARYSIGAHCTWASVFLRHLASTSFMVPFWPYTDPGSVPIPGSAQLEATPVPMDAFYSLNDSSSCFTRCLFSPSDFPPMYSKYLIVIHGNGTHSYCTSHSYVHLHLHSFTSSALLGRLAALDSLCPIQDYTLEETKDIQKRHFIIFRGQPS